MAMKEHKAISSSGWLALLVGLGSMSGSVGPFAYASTHPSQGVYVAGGLAMVAFGIIMLIGNFVVGPNEARVLTFFGRYIGTVRDQGLRWANPFASKRSISLRARNFETAHIKVNDIEGNPIEIGAVVVWRVVDTEQATFEIQNYVNYVEMQTEAAVRNLAMHHPYDSHDDKQLSLRGQSEQVAAQLRAEVSERVKAAGVEVIDARIAHLAYSPEIAQAMLQRQQAGAIIAARTRIVEGAVSMVEMALDQLSKRGIVELDSERKAAMVSNLLVVLCGERATQPVVNAGTLYQA
jgi:regulator of protease activity HflC (stomatin/prohibitin superfamily)